MIASFAVVAMHLQPPRRGRNRARREMAIRALFFGPLGQITVSIPEFLSTGNAIKIRL
jgi:hypothetical protein